MVSLLIDQKRTAERVGTKKELPVPAEIKTAVVVIPPVTSPPKTILKIQDRYLHESCLHLISMTNNKPTKKETLLNSLNSKFKSDNIDANQLIETLVKNGVIAINTNKITYNQQNLNKFANII